MTLIQWILIGLLACTIIVVAAAGLVFLFDPKPIADHRLDADDDARVNSVKAALRPGEECEVRASDFGALDTAANLDVSLRPRVRAGTTLPTIERKSSP